MSSSTYIDSVPLWCWQWTESWSFRSKGSTLAPGATLCPCTCRSRTRSTHSSSRCRNSRQYKSLQSHANQYGYFDPVLIVYEIQSYNLAAIIHWMYSLEFKPRKSSVCFSDSVWVTHRWCSRLSTHCRCTGLSGSWDNRHTYDWRWLCDTCR